MLYAVVACSRCRRGFVVEEGRKQATCAHCSRTLDLANVRAFHRGEDLEEARAALGQLNARLSGRAEEYARAFVPPAPRPASHDDAHQAAAAAARRAVSEKDRADAVARALGEFGLDDLARAFALAGLPTQKAEAHLARMLAAQVVFEPRPLRYRAF
ncbi:MAG: hypothetical protein QOE90_681 [Thermoplasmata archaeon]|jgi:hypothetical protein|nr:hypothetical protein [Thermoplasmata archaeon]